MVLLCGSGPSGELSWWGIVLGIVVPVGNGLALLLSDGKLSLVESCPRTLWNKAWGPRRQFKFYIVLLAVEPALSEFGETAYRKGIGDQQ